MRVPGPLALFAISLAVTVVAVAAGTGVFGPWVSMVSGLYLPALSIFATVCVRLAWGHRLCWPVLALNAVWCLALFAGDDLVLDPRAFAERLVPTPAGAWREAAHGIALVLPPAAAMALLLAGFVLLRARAQRGVPTPA